MPLFKLSFGRKPVNYCMSGPSGVHDPISMDKTNNNKVKDKEELKERETSGSSSSSYNSNSILSGCSRTLSNLRDVFLLPWETDKVSSSSPRSVVSSDFLINPLRHEVVLLDGSTWEVKPGLEGRQYPVVRSKRFVGVVDGGSPVYPGGSCVSSSSLGGGSIDADLYCFSSLACKRCCEKFRNLDALESHHFSKHAVTELAKGDSSRTIVEIIFDTNWSNPNSQLVEIDRVLKVCNLQGTVSRFEEYRDTVKIRASKLPTKHPRCLADGNELLRFHGTTLACPLGTKGSSSLCSSINCGVCRILRNGFSKKDVTNNVGVYTTSTSGRAFEAIGGIDHHQGDQQLIRKALLVCRVVAGRVHKPLEDFQELEGQLGFDSLAGKIGTSSKIEEMYSLDTRALLPCFVVVCQGITCDLVPDGVNCRHHQPSSLSQFRMLHHLNFSR